MMFGKGSSDYPELWGGGGGGGGGGNNASEWQTSRGCILNLKV